MSILASTTETLEMTLANGTDGQELIIVTSGGTANNIVVTPASFTNGTTITFDADNEYARLVFSGATWWSIGTDATIA